MRTMQERLDEGVRYQLGGALQSAIECYTAVAEAAREPALRAEALRRASSAYCELEQPEEALESARRSLDAAEQAGDADLKAEALNAAAAVYLSRGDFERAQPLLERLLENVVNVRIRGIALESLGSIAARRGDRSNAERHFLASYRCFRSGGYARGEAIALNHYGRTALEGGEPEIAGRVFDGALEAAQRLDDLELTALATLNRAEALASRGDLDRAHEELAGALGYFTAAGSPLRRIDCLRLIGDISMRRGNERTARRSYEQALDAARSIDAALLIAQVEERLAALSD